VSVAVSVAVAQLLHQLVAHCADATAPAAFVIFHEGAGIIIRHVGGIALGRHRHIQHCLRQRQLTLRAAQPFVRFHCVQRQPERSRIGQADILGRHADDTATEIKRVGAAVQHAYQPVQRGIGIGAAHRFMQGGNLIVKFLAPLSKASAASGPGHF